MKDIRVVGLVKAFGKTPAVDHVDFEVPAGSIATLLGPSGCGKTTTLRLIAGLEKPDAGEVYVGERLLTSAAQKVFLSPEKRRMGMVFQTYAIWPHMTVFENIAFPLREKRVPTAEIRERVMAMLETLGLEGFHDRPAPRLSCGCRSTARAGSWCWCSCRAGCRSARGSSPLPWCRSAPSWRSRRASTGASWRRAFVRIWVPLLRPAILGAWILLFVLAVRVLDLAVLLAGPGSRMLSVDIFLWTVTGRQEAASVLALLQTALVLAGYFSARLLLGRIPGQSAV